MVDDKPMIKERWEKYYKFLEGLRRTGVCNMYGAAPILEESFTGLSKNEAVEILHSWMDNYDELSKKYGWR